MGAKIWNATKSNPGLWHAFPDGKRAACSANIKPRDEKFVAHGIIEGLGRQAHAECYTAVTDVTQEGEATMAKADDVITANIERLRALRAEGNDEGATELEKETENLISTTVKGAKAIERKAQHRAAMREALAVKPGAQLVADSDDYTAVDGWKEAAAEAVKQLHEGVAAGRKMADTARAAAEIIFANRLQLRYKGLPDMLAYSRAAKDFASYINGEAAKGADDETKAQLTAFERAVQYQMSTVMVDYVRGLTWDAAAELVPGLIRDGHDSAEAAVRSAYAKHRITLPELSQKERNQLAYQAKQEEARKLEAAREAGQNVDAMLAAQKVEHRVASASKALLGSFAELAKVDDAKRRAELKAQFDALIIELSAKSAQL